MVGHAREPKAKCSTKKIEESAGKKKEVGAFLTALPSRKNKSEKRLALVVAEGGAAPLGGEKPPRKTADVF